MPTARATAKTGAAAAAPALAVSDSDPSMTQAHSGLAHTAGASDPDATVVTNSPLSGTVPPRSVPVGTSMGAAAQPSSAGWLPDFGRRYEVLSVLGKGGMGAVYKARDLELDRVVALKLLRPELIPDAAAIQRFKQELLLASKISHRNILRIHDLGDANGVKFISMAYIEGQDLHGVIQKEGRLPLARALNFARQTLEALEAAHREGVVHRDLKPQNIMVGAKDHIYVMDFGLAKSAEADTHMTMTGQVVGTPQYMAPEQVEGGVIDHRADLYAFGLVLDEMLTGELVFKAESAFHLMLMRIREAPRPPRQVVPELPEYVERIVMRCLMRTPDERYQSAREILNDFDAEAAEAVPEQETLALSGARTAARRQRVAAKVVAITLGSAIALGTVIVAVPTLRHRAESLVGLGSPAPPHIAVLPLQVIGDDSRLQLIGLGIQQSLTGKLAAARQVTVTDSAAIDKIDPTKPAARIAAQLGANFLVRGTLQPGKDGKFGIAITLIDMRNGGKQVTLPLIESTSADLLTTEGKIYDEVSSSLSLKLSNDEQAAEQSQTTQNAEAYDFYLQGKNAMRGQADVKNVMKAVGYFQSATEKDGRFALAWAGLADAYMALYNFDKNKGTADNALSAARQASAFDTEFRIPQVHFTVGDILTRTGSTDQALGELRQAVQRAPNVDEGYRRLAHAYLAKQPAEAVAALQRAIEINPFYWLNHNELALAYKKMGNYAGATREWTEVTRLDPENLFALNNLAGLAVLNGRFSDAVANFQAVIKIRPTAPAYSNLGTAYYYLGQYDNAVAAFQKAVDLKPDNALNLENLADGLRLSGRAAQAAPLYEKAVGLALGQLKVNPKDTFTKSILALCYAKTGKNLDAATQIDDAVKLEPADSDLLYSKALVQAFAGEDGAAVATLKEAIAKGAQPYTAKAEPDFARLRTNSEFQAIVAGTPAK